jgi:signal transduction histidine kinase
MEKAKILIVEDESITALDLQARLRGLGYRVPRFVATGEEAIVQAEEIQPHLVLMDIRLKGDMDGIETAELIRQRLDIPVVYLTAYTDGDTLQRAKITEPFGYLLKPFEERELYTTIEMALYKHQADRALRESERQLRLYAKRLETLHQIDQAILAANSAEAISQAVLHRIGQLVPCRQASVIAMNGRTAEATILAVYENGETRTVEYPRIHLPESALGTELQQGKIEFGEHTQLRLAATRAALWVAPTRFYICVPMLTQDGLIGTLNLGADEPDAYSQEQIEIVREVANSLAIAIHHAHLHEQVRQHAAELEVRNAELDAFAHTVAHDLQDPLGLVIGFADTINQDWPKIPSDEVRNYLQIISRTGRKMNNIVHELLLLAEVRKHEVEAEPLEMGSIVAEAQLRLMHLIEEHGAEINLPDAWPLALGYGPWVEEVWVNYLSNAIKYGGQPPHVDLGASLEADNTVRFWVRDYGHGVPPEAQPRLFVPFTRLAQAQAQGHGLGLSIVRHIMDKLGGQVSVESEGVPGRGCVFSFTLPRARS